MTGVDRHASWDKICRIVGCTLQLQPQSTVSPLQVYKSAAPYNLAYAGLYAGDGC